MKTHVKRILAKLGARDRVQAVIFAYESGLAGRLACPPSGRGPDPSAGPVQIRPRGDDTEAARQQAFSRHTIRREEQQMIRKGDRLENPVTGEVLIFHRTSRDTGGESVLIETIVRPGGFVAEAHVHPHQTERFEVLEGTLGLRVGRDELTAKPGDVATVEPGTRHRFWNAGDDDARFMCEVSPALEFESLIETMFTLAAEGKTNRKGLPESAAAGRDREGALRHRAPAVPAGLAAAGGARGGRPSGAGAGLPSHGPSRPAGIAAHCASQFRPTTTRTPHVSGRRAGSFASTRAGRMSTRRSPVACWRSG